MKVHHTCPHCGASVLQHQPTDSRHPLLLNPNGSAHAGTCPERVRAARVVEPLCYCHETSSRNCPAHQNADDGNPYGSLDAPAKADDTHVEREAPGTPIAKALAEAVTGKPNRSLEYWTKRNAEAAKRENGAGTKKGRAK